MTSTTESQETANHRLLGRRIAVLGMTASGKSTLAKRLARLLDVPHIELDAIVHGPNWVDRPMRNSTRARQKRSVATAGSWMATTPPCAT